MTDERTQQAVALDRVRRRVAAIGFFAVAVHGVVGSIVVAEIIDNQGRHGDAIGMMALSGVIAVITTVVVRLILGRNPATWWILVGLVPTVIGFWTLR